MAVDALVGHTRSPSRPQCPAVTAYARPSLPVNENAAVHDCAVKCSPGAGRWSVVWIFVPGAHGANAGTSTLFSLSGAGEASPGVCTSDSASRSSTVPVGTLDAFRPSHTTMPTIIAVATITVIHPPVCSPLRRAGWTGMSGNFSGCCGYCCWGCCAGSPGMSGKRHCWPCSGW